MPYNPTDTVASVLASLDTRATNLEAVTSGPEIYITEGDSISAYTGSTVSMTNLWIDDHPSADTTNLAVAGATIGPSSGFGTNTLNNRLPDLYAAANGKTPILHFMVTNDLTSQTEAEYQQRLTDYINTVRAELPTVKIGVGTLVPGETANYASYNAKRASLNPWIRSQLGSLIDFILPYGEHPIMGVDAAADDSNLYGDGRHPTNSGHGYLLETLNAVLNPILAGAVGNSVNAFTMADRASADPSTEYTSQVVVSGLGMGQTATASITGAGQMRRGTGAFGTSNVTVMNGDIITVRLTSAATDSQQVNTTLTIGDKSDTWNVTTVASVATTVWDQANSDTHLSYPSARKAVGPANGAPGYNSVNVVRADKGYSAGKYAYVMTVGPETGGSTFKTGLVGDTNNTFSKPGSTTGNTSAGMSYASNGEVEINGTKSTAFPAFSSADTILFCVEIDDTTLAAKVWIAKYDSNADAWAFIQGDPVAGTGAFEPVQTPNEWQPGTYFTRTESATLNTGQDPFPAPLPAGFTQWG